MTSRHRRSFGEDCFTNQGDGYAVPDWSRYTRIAPNLDSIIKYRDPLGRPIDVDGVITAKVLVKCVHGFLISRSPLGEYYGNGIGYNSLGTARFYILNVESVDPDSQKPSQK